VLSFSRAPLTSAPRLFPLSLHDALPISLLSFPPSSDSGFPHASALTVPPGSQPVPLEAVRLPWHFHKPFSPGFALLQTGSAPSRSEEHTSELQSRFDLVCRLLLEKKK